MLRGALAGLVKAVPAWRTGGECAVGAAVATRRWVSGMPAMPAGFPSVPPPPTMKAESSVEPQSAETSAKDVEDMIAAIEKKHGHRLKLFDEFSKEEMMAEMQQAQKDTKTAMGVDIDENPFNVVRQTLDSRIQLLSNPSHYESMIAKLREKPEEVNMAIVDDLERKFKPLAAPNSELLEKYKAMRERVIDVEQNMKNETVEIDWEEWREKLGPFADTLRASFDEIPKPKYEELKALDMQEVEKIFKPIMEEAEKVCEEADLALVEIDKTQQDIYWVQDNLDTMTVEEFLDKFPDVRDKIDEEIRNNEWYIDE